MRLSKVIHRSSTRLACRSRREPAPRRMNDSGRPAGAEAERQLTRRGSSARLFQLLKQPRHECCPTGLVACPTTPAGVAVEVFIEQDLVTPVRISRESDLGRMRRSRPI